MFFFAVTLKVDTDFIIQVILENATMLKIL